MGKPRDLGVRLFKTSQYWKTDSQTIVGALYRFKFTDRSFDQRFMNYITPSWKTYIYLFILAVCFKLFFK